MPRIPRPDLHRMDVQVPLDLHAEIARSAQADGRSVARQVVTLLREALAARAKRRR